MGESLIQFTEGTGKKVHSWQRTVGANAVEDEFVLPGEYPLPGYIVATTAGSVSTATSGDHLLQLMAGSSLKVRIRRIMVEQAGNATTGGPAVFNLYRLTSAGTGGSSLTPRPFDPADAASGATAMTLPSSKGTEGVQLMRRVMLFRQTVGSSGSQANDLWTWEQHPGMPPIIIAAGTTNGIAIKNEAAYAGATVNISIEFVETSY